jgi:hypothetical protein
MAIFDYGLVNMQLDFCRDTFPKVENYWKGIPTFARKFNGFRPSGNLAKGK